MATTYADAAAKTVLATAGRERDRSTSSHRLPVRAVVLAVLRRGRTRRSHRLDGHRGGPALRQGALTNYSSTLHPETTGFRAGILGCIWVMLATAALSVPLGIAAALLPRGVREPGSMVEPAYRDQPPEPGRRTIRGLRPLGRRVRGRHRDSKSGVIVIAGAIALSLLILPVIIITTREAVRAVPREIRDGSLALGATQWQTTWRQTLPAAVPGIATGRSSLSPGPSARRRRC